MARIDNGILGAFTGKVGSVVGYIRKGRPVLRSRPATKGKKNKGTPAQQMARMRFGVLRKFVRKMVPAMTIGFRSRLDREMVHCVGFSELWGRGVVGEAPDCTLDYSKVVVSSGYWAGLSDAEVRSEGNEIIASWNPEIVATPAEEDDEVYLAVYSEEENREVWVCKPVERRDGQIRTTKPKGEVHCWLFAGSTRNNKTSTSQYFKI